MFFQLVWRKPMDRDIRDWKNDSFFGQPLTSVGTLFNILTDLRHHPIDRDVKDWKEWEFFWSTQSKGKDASLTLAGFVFFVTHGCDVDRLVDVDKDGDCRGNFSTFRQNFCRRRQVLVDSLSTSTSTCRRFVEVDNPYRLFVDVDSPYRRLVDVDKHRSTLCRWRQHFSPLC